MGKKNIRSIISALILYGTEQEKRLARLAEQHLNLEGSLTKEQKLALESSYREKTNWMKHTIISMKAR